MSSHDDVHDEARHDWLNEREPEDRPSPDEYREDNDDEDEDETVVTTSVWEIPADLAEKLAQARARWAKLEEAGTPYWCVHEGREVDHPAAYWREDRPNDPLRKKHGVFCRDCNGYIQEG